MTTRLKGLQVTFTKDIREDDAQVIIDAIRLIRGVEDVRPIESTHEDSVIEVRTLTKLRKEISEIFTSELDRYWQA